MAPGAAKNGPKTAEEGSKTIPDRKSDEEPHQDDHMTGLGPQGEGGTPSLVPPYGHHFGIPNDPKQNLKRSKIEAKNDEVKRAIQDDLGPVLGRSWAL